MYRVWNLGFISKKIFRQIKIGSYSFWFHEKKLLTNRLFVLSAFHFMKEIGKFRIIKAFRNKLHCTLLFSRNLIPFTFSESKIPSAVWKLCTQIYYHVFLVFRKFVKAMHLLKKSLNSWFDEIFFRWVRVNFSFFHTVIP